MKTMDNEELIGLLESLLSPAIQPAPEVGTDEAGYNTDEAGYDAYDAEDVDDLGDLATAPLGAPGGYLPGETGLPVIDATLGDEPTVGLYGYNATDGGSASGITTLLQAPLPVGLAILDARTQAIRRTNPALLQMLGCLVSSDDAIGKRLTDLAPGFAGSEVEAALTNVALTGRPYSAIVERSGATKGGAAVFHRCTLSPLRQTSDSAEVLLLSLLDVTDEVQARNRVRNAAERLDQQTRRAQLVTTVLAELGRTVNVSEAFAFVAARLAEALGDCCAIFTLDGAGTAYLSAVQHNDSLTSFELHRRFAENPLAPGEGIVGEAVRALAPVVRIGAYPGEVPDLHPRVPVEGVAAAACVPLLLGNEPLGALLVFTQDAVAHGSGKTLTQHDVALLADLAVPIALAARGDILRQSLADAEVERRDVLSLLDDAVAVFDEAGRLRHANPAAEQVLALGGPLRPGAVTPRYLDDGGMPLRDDALPWARALLGVRTGARIVVETGDGTHRAVRVRAAPVRGGDGTIVGSVALARPEAGGDAPATISPTRITGRPLTRSISRPISMPLADTLGEDAVDLGDLCARVARGHAGPTRRQIEVRIPKRHVLVAAPADALERALASLLSVAARHTSGALLVHLWVEGSRRGPASRPLQAGPLPSELSVSSQVAPIAVVRISPSASAVPHMTGERRTGAPLPGAEIADTEGAEAERNALLLGGAFWRVDDPATGPSFLISIPCIEQ